MSTNIRVQRICQHCGNEFTARTTTTMYCSHRCNSAAYKAKQRTAKVERSNKETQRKKNQPVEDLKAKEFLAVREVAQLLNCSVRSVYYYIESGTIKAVNLGQRITRVKRSEIDRLFEQPLSVPTAPEPQHFDISECYHLAEVQGKFGISETALHNLIKRNDIPKMKKGWFAYVPKTAIDKLLS
ncbi:MAG: helix-turn-helix domain-containing protein [Flavobacteriales bacterium]|nr:helix-turn-helix domain-containing protein [Flavobacteriales bacterium]